MKMKTNEQNISNGYVLLPCPFCGTYAKFNEDSRWIQCQNPDCGVALIGPDYNYESSANAWNKRVECGRYER